jgi:hypothetical protein
MFQGGLARDEKREVLRALRNCPIERIIMIGRSFPLANTWGEGAALIAELEGDTVHQFSDHFEAENMDVISASTRIEPQTARKDIAFEPVFGWHGQPMLLTIASLFASSIKELKFCGFHGSLILDKAPGPNDITPGILHHLRYFHNLEQLILSMYILRDQHVSRSDMIDDWRSGQLFWDSHDIAASRIEAGPDCVPLVLEDTISNEDQTSTLDFDQYIRNHRGLAMAWSLWHMISPHLSPKALQKGLCLRASFCIGSTQNEDIFDLDINMNEKGITTVTGPRSIWDGGRWWTKMTERRYF